jgi:hypothetical protein
MNEKADIWIFYAQSDEEFGDMIAEKIKTDISDNTIKTSSDLGEPPPLMPSIDRSNIVLRSWKRGQIFAFYILIGKTIR